MGEQQLGAVPAGDGRALVRVWAPRADAVAVRVARRGETALEREERGMWAGAVPAGGGDDYWIVLDGRRLPDPATRWQPRGLRGPSRVLDTAALRWTDDGFTPPAMEDLVVYELHVGTFTPEGTFDGAIARLRELAELGITAVEVMPVAEFPGARGWGYDGVYLAAAQSSYGGPEAFARFVDAAHGAGLAVILDVVLNHVGASGNRALRAFGPYFTDKYSTFWGEAINYDDAGSDAVREWACQSVEHWVRDLHVDGVRLDAIHAIFDQRPEHIVAEVARRVHAARPGAIVIAESGLNDPKVMRGAGGNGSGGWGCDAAWADDFHHALRTLVTDERDGYYAEFGRVADLAKAMHRPHVHDGTWSAFRDRTFGAPADDLPRSAFVVFDQNHDQVGNRAFGDRLPAESAPLAAFVTLLSGFVPMLFMGEEYRERAPFQFFCDHIDKRIADATREGRRREFAAFAEFAGEEVPDPQDPATFARSKLTWDEDRTHRDLVKALLRTRRDVRGEAECRFDEDARWLVVRRGDHELACNFAREPRAVPVDGRALALATHHDDTRMGAGAVALPALGGALIK
ncbi:malto-oligosyltrehalose trehalohydrolase [Capillimicrobium parvum]|uniref:Malto-oligosyltrehalose trehalohydrolase n=1 Tax=Capillimicrobium parvum TaxID=2884022 RepID=A0A9E6Y0K1_9ACTN|nr:malto-oligosyltrehalose trehalohydrolase [Capillimicrobium parvum]UGS37563.1 Malto-oligosyltrehalose trehalohydrolase [Capillimicrobium parvum]